MMFANEEKPLALMFRIFSFSQYENYRSKNLLLTSLLCLMELDPVNLVRSSEKMKKRQT